MSILTSILIDITPPQRAVHLAFRAVAALCSLVTLIFILYCTAKFDVTLGVGYASASWTLVFDLASMFLLWKQHKRLSNLVLSMTEVFIFGLVTAAIISMRLVSLQEDLGAAIRYGGEHRGFRADPWRNLAVGLQGAVGLIHLGFLAGVGREIIKPHLR
ncbi:hypothetical protein BDV95DRAFT_602074 [Massariosphaeria phaeospora]|uniref:MARVEL domain-containing protein n=1 Tax=Massariosphaeria phaeospora TaxID=100035 RepID=A0A7C8MJ92_9PLEO|nr:hypothetical protein BDV95DRAFT_602074 [Massariosphaeria phaeospora]